MSQVSHITNRPLAWLGLALPSWPLVVWMVAAALGLGLAGGLDADELIRLFNKGWGRALGEFALILLPSFVLAAALAEHTKTGRSAGAASAMAVAASPFAAASMICPDTAYAALSPVAGKQRLAVAFGSYAGFKLIFPAGPLIVATGLGIESSSLMFYGLALLIPVWAVAICWAKLIGTAEPAKMPEPSDDVTTAAEDHKLLLIFSPFLALAGLLVAGGLMDFSEAPLLDFLTKPKGALIFAAVWALLSLPKSQGQSHEQSQRRACIDSAVRRTGSLLLVIGAASAFGAVLTSVVPINQLLPRQAGLLGIIGLFGLTVVFKLAQGSSMATFAAIAPVAAPIVAASHMPSAAAVFAICLGSFIAILPNDSFYWLVRQDHPTEKGEGRMTLLLAGGAAVQGLTGLALLLAYTALGQW